MDRRRRAGAALRAEARRGARRRCTGSRRVGRPVRFRDGRALGTLGARPGPTPRGRSPASRPGPDMKIRDTVFLVTGGGSGLGAATAQMLCAEGARVVLADVNPAGEQLARQLGAGARFVKADVTEEASMQSAVDLCVSAFGAIHGLVNCAGVAPGERVVGRSGPHALASFERAVKINLVGTFNAIRLAAAKMSVQPAFPNGERGVIVITSSVASFEGQIGQAAYAASKAGVNGMTLPIARELAKFGIRVVTIAPGIFDT